jgi:hypothetical protein
VKRDRIIIVTAAIVCTLEQTAAQIVLAWHLREWITGIWG